MTKKTVDWFIILLNICKFYINYASLDVLIVFTSKLYKIYILLLVLHASIIHSYIRIDLVCQICDNVCDFY